MNINLWEVAANIATILVLYLVYKKFLFKPVTAFMKKREDTYVTRKQTLEAGIEKLKRDENEQARLSDARYKQSGEDAEKIVSEANRQADKLLEDARQQILRLREDERAALRVERIRMREKMHMEAAELVLTVSSQVLSRELNQQEHERLVQEYLREVEAG